MKDLQHLHAEHEESLREELICHLPYAAFSVALSFIMLALLSFFSMGLGAYGDGLREGYHVLFHAFHYVHLVFAIVGTVISFMRFSNNIVRCAVISLISPAIFCTLSDVALPALAGNILGLEVPLHICFFSLPDLANILPFMLVGLITGLAIVSHEHEGVLRVLSLRSHFVHICISSLAASCYVMSYGFEEWHVVMGMLFLFLVVAVVVPCTISDLVVPWYFARIRAGK